MNLVSSKPLLDIQNRLAEIGSTVDSNEYLEEDVADSISLELDGIISSLDEQPVIQEKQIKPALYVVP